MKFSSFFITRPIFAIVLSVLIVVAGLLALLRLPISEYPGVVPPTVVVRAAFPGANPKVIAETVAAPLEQQMNGVEGMLYMFSQATSDGALTLTITFALGTDLDIAQVQVQNRVAQTLPRLPQDVQRIGVTTEKASPDFIMVVHLVSPDERYDMLYLSNYAHLQVKDEISRLPGVGAVQVFGAGEYSMRVWLDPDRLASRQLTTSDVVRAIREQNIQVAAGVLGAPPAPSDATFQLSINTRGRLSTEAEFGNIVVRATPEGQITRLSDVARLELGSSRYSLRSLLDNKPAVAIGVFQRPGTNALQASTDVHATMERLKQNFPPGVDYRIVYDPTVFVRESINAVAHTLLEAILLVVIVVVVFLQTWRASIIPLVAVPVSLIGTFAVMLGLGFSLNTLSLFGLVLAIGIVVDDAIVVVENVERHIELGQPPMDATRKAMEEVSGPIIAIALVLGAVFVPTAFISGLTGQFYRQFALTIAISTVISAFNSLTLSPALASRLLLPHGAERDRVQRLIDRLFGWFFRGFNRVFHAGSSFYAGGVDRVLRVAVVALAVYAGLVGLTGLGFRQVPQGFIPAQDKDYLVAFAQLPDGATLDRTERVIRQMSSLAMSHPGVSNSVAFPGLSINGFVNASNTGIAFVTLKPSAERAREKGMDAMSIVMDLNQRFGAIQDAYVAIFPPPPVQGLGTVGGFKLYVEDRASLGFEQLYQQVQNAADRRAAGARAGGSLLQLPGERAADRRGRRSRAGEDLRHPAHGRLRHAAGVSRVAVRERLQPVRPDLPGERAGGVVVPHAAGADRAIEDPQRTRRHGAARIGAARQPQLRTRSGDALQRVSGRRDQRRAVAGLQLRTGAERHRGGARADAAQRDDVRVDGAGVSGRHLRQHHVPDLPAVRAARLRRAGRAVRELVAAADRDPDRPDVAARGDRRRLAHGRGQQRLHADQLSRARRPCLQELDPHRRVRAAA